MIILEGVTAGSAAADKESAVLRNVSVELPSNRRVVILGHAKSGKTTLINLLAGLMLPDAGTIKRFARLSFPIGYWKIFDPQMTVHGNIMFIAERYGSDPDEVLMFLDRALGLSGALEESISSVSRQMKVRLSYALGYALHYDTYLIDNNAVAGDPDFRGLCEGLFESRIRESGMIFVTSRPEMAKRYGEVGGTLMGGKLTIYDDVNVAVASFLEGERRSAEVLYRGAAQLK